MEGMSPQAQAAWARLTAAYPNLQVTSGYRDPARNAAVGGAKGSQHLHGNALDVSVADLNPQQRIELAEAARAAGFQGFGFYDNSMHVDVGPSRAWGPSYGRESVPDWAAGWVNENTGGGAAPQSGGAPMGLLSPTGSNSGERDRPQGGDFFNRLALAANSLRARPDPGVSQLVASRQESRAQREAANRTAAWLETSGRPDLAEAVRGGMMDGATAFNTMTTRPEQTALERNVQFLMGQGYPLKDALAAVQGASGGTNINMNDPLKIMPDGRIAVADPAADGGVRFVTPPGSAAAETADTKQNAVDQKTSNAETYGDAAVQAIDALLGGDGQPGLINDGEGLFNVGNVGVSGQKLADFGLSQSAVDVKNTLKTVTSNIAFSRLQAMRDASVTGGALGSVTENELAMLMNSLGAVAQDTSAPLLRQNLQTIRAIWTKINADPVARRAYYGSAQPGQAQSEPAGGFTVTEQF